MSTKLPRSFLLVAVVTLLHVTVDRPALRAQSAPDALGVEVGLQGSVFDNFFRVSDEDSSRLIGAVTVTGRLLAPLDTAGRTTAFLEGSLTDFASLGPSPGVTARFRSIGRTHVYDVRAGYEWNRPATEVGDLLELSDVARVVGRYTFRPGNTLQLGAAGMLQYNSFKEYPSNDGTFFRGEGSVRYRGFGYRFVPEIGASYGAREAAAAAANPDFEERNLFARIVSVPVPWLWTSFRYGVRTRNFEVADPAASNFEREDRHDHWTVAAAVDVTPRTTLNIYYNFLNADSNRGLRTFDSQMVTMGVTWAY